jgi:drug/metabolite transporter (DMT)-like permease
MSIDLRRGALHVTAAGAAFALMSAFAKAASQAGVSNYLLVFARNIVSVTVLLPLLLRQGSGAFRTRRFGGHLWRSAFGLLGMYTLYYAISHLSLAEALLLNYSSPLFIPFIAWLVLRERPPALLIPASLLGLAGVALIVKPASLGLSLAALVGAASGVFAACAMVSLRRISDTEPAQRVVFYFGAIGLVVSAIPLYWHWQPLDGQQLGYMLGTGLFATLGQLQLTRAYACAPAARVGAMGYSAVVFAGLIGWLVWGETPDAWSLLGAALVISTCILASWQPAPKAAANRAPISPEDAGS